MTPARWIAATIAGLCLATLPFWRYLPLAGGVDAHMDHEPRHGGQLGMAGDHHVEMLRRRGRVEVFVSDARRRPEHPRAVWIVFDRQAKLPLAWQSHRFVGADNLAAREVEAQVVLADAGELTISFGFAEDVSTANR